LRLRRFSSAYSLLVVNLEARSRPGSVFPTKRDLHMTVMEDVDFDALAHERERDQDSVRPMPGHLVLDADVIEPAE
jgi:hypothetical protein